MTCFHNFFKYIPMVEINPKFLIVISVRTHQWDSPLTKFSIADAVSLMYTLDTISTRLAENDKC